MTVTAWLKTLGLSQYEEAFEKNHISTDLLPRLTGSDLIDLGVTSIGHRRIMLDAAQSLETDEEVPSEQSLPERRQLTILFCDIVGSTSLSESLDPEDMAEVIGAYHDTCRAVLVKHGAYIANFMGDGVMAYFGYPKAREDDAASAVRASLELLETLKNLKTPAGIGINTRVGLDTGLLVISDLARETTMGELSGVGRTSNRAARIQALAESQEILVSSRTQALCRRDFQFDDIGEHHLRGISEPVHVWRVLQDTKHTATENSFLAPYIGREDELALIESKWDLAITGRGQTVTVYGDSGLGKTRIGQMVQMQLADIAHHKFHFAELPTYSLTAFHTLISPFIAEAKITVSDGLALMREKLAHMLSASVEEDRPFLDHLLATTFNMPAKDQPQPLDDPSSLKHWLFEKVQNVFDKAAQENPVLIVLDDAQWADPTSMEFFTAYAETVKSTACFFVTLSRPEWTAPWEENAHNTSLTLNPLNDNETHNLIEGVAGNHRLPAAVMERVLTASDGIPLYAEELTRGIVEILSTNDEQASEKEWSVPGSLMEVLMARLDGLGDARRVALYASCIGRVFHFGVLRKITRMGDEELHNALQTLITMNIFVPQTEAGDRSFSFRHMLVRETAYKTLLRTHRRDLHGQIAEAMEESSLGYGPEVLANHYDKGDVNDKAAELWLAFAERQLSLGGYAESVEALQHSRQRLAADFSKSESLARIELKTLSALGAALIALRPTAADEIGEIYEDAYALTQRIGTVPETGTVLFGLAVFFFFRGDFTRTEDLANKLVRLGQELGDPGLEGGARMMLGQITFWRGHHDDFQKNYHLPPPPDTNTMKDVQIARFAQDPQVTSRIPYVWSLNLTGKFEQAESECNWVMDYVQRLNHPYSRAQALQLVCWHHVTQRNWGASLKTSDEFLTLTQEQGFMMFYDISTIVNLWAKAHTDPLFDGFDAMDEILRRVLAGKGHLLVNAATCLLAELALKERKFEEGLAAIDRALEPSRTEDCAHVPALNQLRAKLLFQQGGADDEARHLLINAYKEAQTQGALLIALRSSVALLEHARQTKHKDEDADLRRLNDILKHITPPKGLADEREVQALL